MLRPKGRLFIHFALMWLGIACLLAFLLHESRKGIERKIEADAVSIASLLEARLAVTLRRIQADAEHVAVSLPVGSLEPENGGRYRDLVQSELGLYLRHFPEVLGIHVIDRHGDLLYSSGRGGAGAEVAAKLHLSRAPDSRNGGLHFHDVVTERAFGRSMLPMVLGAKDSAGHLKGLVVVPLDLDYLAKVMADIDLGPGGVISLRRTDEGRLILRRPGLPDQVNQGLVQNPLQARLDAGETSGFIRFHATIDGVERMYGFRRIGDYPLYVTAGLALDDYLADWRKALAVAGISALILLLALTLLMIRVLNAEREENATASRLVESEARYRMLAESSHDVIWTLDIPTRRYTYVSPSVTELCGYLPEDLIGQPMDARLTPETAMRVTKDIDLRLRRIAAGDKSANVVVSEMEQLCKDGSVISTEVVSSYLLDADGVPRTILGITRNVNERKAAEFALRETNRQLHARIEEIGRLQVALQELAVRDSLTGLYNRRYLDETLEREVSRVRREGIPLSLVMLDIDHFKRVNDTYGHQVGDEALRKLAATLLADIRAEDVACRYGGEEFLVLLPNMPLETAMIRAEAWRQAVEGLSVTLGNFQIGFTISLGVAAYPDHGKTPDDLTRCADQALYRAKNEGRNQVCVFQRPTVVGAISRQA